MKATLALAAAADNGAKDAQNFEHVIAALKRERDEYKAAAAADERLPQQFADSETKHAAEISKLKQVFPYVYSCSALRVTAQSSDACG